MSSNNIYSLEMIENIISKNAAKFKPTYLILRRHTKTGMLYLHKTNKLKQLETYLGSGKKWTNHINKHGREHVEIIWFCLFYECADCVHTAFLLSEIMRVQDSPIFYNQIIEIGVGGGSPGHPGLFGENNGMYNMTHNIEAKERMSTAAKDWHKENPDFLRGANNPMKSQESRNKISIKAKERHAAKTEEEKRRPEHSLAMTGIGNPMFGKKQKRVVCEFCLKTISVSMYGRWHGEKCKYHPTKKLIGS